MDARAVRWVVVAVALGGLAAPARRAAAFTMGEQMATTGVANTVAGTGASSAASTIGSVKNKLSSSTGLSTPPKVAGAAKVSGKGAGMPTHKRTAKGNAGWGEAKGWAKNGKGGGKGGKGGKGGWADQGGWPKADGWSSKGGKKTWAEAGGGSWARPGNKRKG